MALGQILRHRFDMHTLEGAADPLRWKWRLMSVAVVAVVACLLNWQIFLRCFYPIEYAAEISTHSQVAALDPYLVAAIIRVESNFQPDARSPKGAMGLMQLMPDTAAWVAQKMGRDYRELDLVDPGTNISLGTWYMKMLQEEFGGDLVVALAAYNGGRGNVNRWLAENRWDGRLESVGDIPFLETRLYVQRVLGNYDWYLRLYGGAWPPQAASLPMLPDVGRQLESWWHRGRQILHRYRGPGA